MDAQGFDFYPKEKMESLRGAWQIPLLAVLILGAIYTGICTPTEAAAVGTFMAMVIGVLVVGLKKLRLPQGLRGTITSATMIYAILIGAFIFSSFMSVSRIPTMLSEMIQRLGSVKELVMLIIIVIYTVLGHVHERGRFHRHHHADLFSHCDSLGYDPIW